MTSSASRPRRVALAVCVAAGKILAVAVLLPAARSCGDDIRPIDGLVEPGLSFLLVPHVFGLLAAVACALFLTGWARRFRVLEVGLVVWAVLSGLALTAFFAFSLEAPAGPALALGCLGFFALLLARSDSWRWRAVRAVWVGALQCLTWYGFWIVLSSSGPDSDEALLWGTYVAASASFVLFVVARRLEREVPRWTRRRSD